MPNPTKDSPQALEPRYTHLLVKPDSNVEITDLYRAPSEESLHRIRNESNRYSEYSAHGSLGQIAAFKHGHSVSGFKMFATKLHDHFSQNYKLNLEPNCRKFCNSLVNRLVGLTRTKLKQYFPISVQYVL